MNRTIGTALAALSLAALLSGCSTEAFCFSCGDEATPALDAGQEAAPQDGAGGAGGVIFGDGGPSEAGPDADAGDSADGCGADTQNDPKNCGACGNVCDLLGAFPKCVAGACAIDSCAPGHYDSNGIASDGCEYACTPANGGVEACNGKDDDCNGTIDEGFDLAHDVANCGACGSACDLPNATPACQPSGGVGTCAVSSCTDGFANLDGLSPNGCEYQCPVWPPVAETCNGLDDDCDGQVNEDDPEGGTPCESNCPGGVCQGECTAGVTHCSGTALVCVGGQGPTLEVCDGKDNDCDGVVDNGFDLTNDPLNCGACGHVCTASGAVGACQNKACVIATCTPGHADLDHDPSNGCEYACPVVPPRVESCNGLDDDCNGVVDDASVLAAQKPPSAGCYPTANTPCAGADFVCTGTKGWRCDYGPGVEVDANGKLVVVEAKCDGIDGNCNGQVDEAFPDVGTACDNGLLGACRDVGERVCDPSDVSRTICDLSFPPDAVPGAPSSEACNGVDDDCNGAIDDGIVDDMVAVTSGGTTFYIDRYEASRPDATPKSGGTDETRRCVNQGVLPWVSTTQAKAAAACAATGARLCTSAELQAACAGTAGNAYPYGASYEPLSCNGLDYDGVPGGADDDVLVPTGSLAACATADALFDLSGNAAEWTSTVTGNTGAPQNLTIFMAMGGSYKSPALGLSCQFTLSRYASNAILPELGFRCCRD